MDQRESRGAEHGGERDEIPGDLISRLPDDLLCTIISLLPTKDGRCTPTISPRWRNLRRSAPLNLVIHSPVNPHSPSSVDPSAVSRIVSKHLGPTRRFFFRGGVLGPQAERWFLSRALANLQELDIKLLSAGTDARCPMPPSALSSPALLVVKLGYCRIPNGIIACRFHLGGRVPWIALCMPCPGELLYVQCSCCGLPPYSLADSKEHRTQPGI